VTVEKNGSVAGCGWMPPVQRASEAGPMPAVSPELTELRQEIAMLREQLQALYAKLDPEKETIVYCQSGIRASETATVLQDLGFKNVKVYDSSWIGYGATLEAPAEDVTFFNVGNMQAKLTALQKRLDAMEKELAAAKSAR
jgi:rhodanese-related sulfurtransferase